MFTPINVKDGNYENLVLWDTHDIYIKRNGNNGELVIHPAKIANLKIRFACDPYTCKIYFSKKNYNTIDIGVEECWGEIDTTDHSHPKYGNDEDGYRAIKKVVNDFGDEIPLEKFSQDVEDQMMYFEA